MGADSFATDAVPQGASVANEFAPTKSMIEMLFADDYLAVIDKPAGLMAHASPMARGEDDFLDARLRAQFGGPVHLVHRLDRATSGCLLVARDRDTASILGKRFMSGEVDKDYLAICRGWPDESFVVDYALDGGPGKPEKKPAVTVFERLASAEIESPSEHHPTSRYALLRCSPQTGRYRQIRRHLKHLSHHLVGDSSHGDGRHNRTFRMLGVHRMLLHAWRLSFVHPHSGARIDVKSPLDAEWRKAMAALGWDPAVLDLASANA